MKVVVISEECHGEIGIAKDFNKAKDFLIEKDWINSDTELYVEEKDGWFPINEILGEDWENQIRNMTEEDFVDTFDTSFILENVWVYGT